MTSINGLKPVTILLVEDDDGDAKGVQRAFQKAKLRNPIHRAVDGIEAVTMLRGGEIPCPRILLVDLNMPRMNGLEFVRTLRSDQELRQSVIFILTTSEREEDKIAAYNLNVSGYVSKAKAAEDFQNLVQLLDDYNRIVSLPQ